MRMYAVSTLSLKSQSSMVVIAASLLIGTLAQPAAAIEERAFGFETTKDLYRVCSTDAGDPDFTAAQVACTAFIEATIQYHDAVSDRKRLKRLTCYPQGATIADGQKAFVAWGARNADNARRMGELPVVGLIRALAKAYPCK
jgi:hypothetical protein